MSVLSARRVRQRRVNDRISRDPIISPTLAQDVRDRSMCAPSAIVNPCADFKFTMPGVCVWENALPLPSVTLPRHSGGLERKTPSEGTALTWWVQRGKIVSGYSPGIPVIGASRGSSYQEPRLFLKVLLSPMNSKAKAICVRSVRLLRF